MQAEEVSWGLQQCTLEKMFILEHGYTCRCMSAYIRTYIRTYTSTDRQTEKLMYTFCAHTSLCTKVSHRLREAALTYEYAELGSKFGGFSERTSCASKDSQGISSGWYWWSRPHRNGQYWEKERERGKGRVETYVRLRVRVCVMSKDHSHAIMHLLVRVSVRITECCQNDPWQDVHASKWKKPSKRAEKPKRLRALLLLRHVSRTNWSAIDWWSSVCAWFLIIFGCRTREISKNLGSA